MVRNGDRNGNRKLKEGCQHVYLQFVCCIQCMVIRPEITEYIEIEGNIHAV